MDGPSSRRVYGALQISVRGIRGVRAGHAKPVSVEFMFGGDGKSIPVRSDGLATSLQPQTLIFTSWACASDTVRLSVIAHNGNSNGNGNGNGSEKVEVATGSVEVSIQTALSRTPRKTASAWHIIVDDSGEEIAEVMMFLRWQAMESYVVPPPSLLAKETVNERGAPDSWPTLSSAYDVAKTLYCQVASISVASPIAKAVETLLANGCSLLAERVHSDRGNNGSGSGVAEGPREDVTQQLDQCVKDALDKADAALLTAFHAGLECLGWAAESIDYYKVGTASNIQKLVDLACQPFRQPLDALTTNSNHGSNCASDTSDEAEKAAGSPLRRGIFSNGIEHK